MYIPIENDKIKFNARKCINGNLWYFWKMIFAIMVANLIFSYIPELIFGGSIQSINDIITGSADTIPKEASLWPYFGYFALQIILNLLVVPASYGVYHNCLNYSRGVSVDKWEIMAKPYKSLKLFFKFIGLYILSALLVLLWSILLIVPGLIKAISYSLAPFILYDEPELSIVATLKKSSSIMKGYKGRAFILGLSFIGWIILGPFTFGLLYIWLYPYMLMTLTMFYDELRRAYYNGDPASQDNYVNNSINHNRENSPFSDDTNGDSHIDDKPFSDL